MPGTAPLLQRPAYEAPLAPGYYEPDPLGERATGTLNMAAGEVHHGVPLARDPTRASAVFVAAPRWAAGAKPLPSLYMLLRGCTLYTRPTHLLTR